MNSWKGWQFIFCGIFLIITVIYGVLFIVAVIGSEQVMERAVIWVIAGIAAYNFLMIMYHSIHERVKNNCEEKSGHKWNGCKCMICATENHEWEYLKETSFGAGNNKVRGHIRQHNHLCKKCGKVMRSRK